MGIVDLNGLIENGSHGQILQSMLSRLSVLEVQMIYKIADVYQTYMGSISRTYSNNMIFRSIRTQSNGVSFASSKNKCITGCQLHSGTSYRILEGRLY